MTRQSLFDDTIFSSFSLKLDRIFYSELSNLFPFQSFTESFALAPKKIKKLVSSKITIEQFIKEELERWEVRKTKKKFVILEAYTI